VIRVNHRKVLNGVLETAGIPEDDARTRGIVLRAIDKLDRLGPEGVRALLGEGRKDESGDFTEGARLPNDAIATVMKFANAPHGLEGVLMRRTAAGGQRGQDAQGALRALRGTPSRTEIDPQTGEADPFIDEKRLNGAWIEYFDGLIGVDSAYREGLDDLMQIVWLCQIQGYSADRIVIDPSVVRGLGYYTGPVYEAELTFQITDDEGNRRQFGSVAGGGRYDDLVKRFTGQSVPATGISIGVDRLLAALREIGQAGKGDAAGPVVILAMDRDQMAAYQTMCAELRKEKIRAEVFLGGGNMARQLKYADKRAAPIAVIEGGDERAQGVVTLKDLALGARLAAEIETHEEWKAQPAQITVPRADLVIEVRRMLARAGGRGR
jgi:histidyl-tRNA synthetase